MSRQPIHRWHGAHHYSDKVHLLFVVFIFFGVFTFIWSYFTLSNIKVNDKNSDPNITTITPTPIPTCIPRPACLDATPRCLIPETEDMCPPTITPTKPTDQIACTQEAKLCPDGKTYVGRSGPNCEFSNCP